MPPALMRPANADAVLILEARTTDEATSANAALEELFDAGIRFDTEGILQPSHGHHTKYCHLGRNLTGAELTLVDTGYALAIPIPNNTIIDHVRAAETHFHEFGLEFTTETISEDNTRTRYWHLSDLPKTYFRVTDTVTLAGQLSFPFPTDDTKDAVFAAADALAEAGVTFDTRTWIAGDTPTHLWKLDWNLEGAALTTTSHRVVLEIPITNADEDASVREAERLLHTAGISFDAETVSTATTNGDANLRRWVLSDCDAFTLYGDLITE